MFPLLFILWSSVPVPITVEPHDNSTLCREVDVELTKGVSLGLLTADEADGIHYRCLYEYSQGNY